MPRRPTSKRSRRLRRQLRRRRRRRRLRAGTTATGSAGSNEACEVAVPGFGQWVLPHSVRVPAAASGGRKLTLLFVFSGRSAGVVTTTATTATTMAATAIAQGPFQTSYGVPYTWLPEVTGRSADYSLPLYRSSRSLSLSLSLDSLYSLSLSCSLFFSFPPLLSSLSLSPSLSLSLFLVPSWPVGRSRNTLRVATREEQIKSRPERL